ncbi:hypothetical protein K435DRAFT_801174 [Dendrothele bispora CBS 962.96]|uniref:Uncharacterized protein n=2 Tax=Dendrothele bispora (strain CBS 962.96) TaxID=1314807 RepID=A0A4S8LQ65_DENBC|nr:hypothetical protein K435DRAFT_801174 [Dendrothele bispora CBS 962.96]
MSLPQTQSSLPLSDSDILVLKEWVFETALGFLLLGIQTTLSIAVLCTFVLDKTADQNTEIPANGFNPPDLGRIILLDTRLTIGENFMARLNFIMGDIIVVWRAWVLFPQRFAKIALSICLIGSFVGIFLDIGLLVKRVIKNPEDVRGEEENAIMVAVPLILTNFTATTLIGFKAWYHFQNIRNNLGSTNGSSNKALKILLLLMESGLLYLAFWIGYLVLELVTHNFNTSIAQDAYLVMMPQLVAIYPILIILVVAHQNNKPENGNDMSLSQSIQFASVQAFESEVHDSAGEPQQVHPPAGFDNLNSAEVERNKIEVVPRLS